MADASLSSYPASVDNFNRISDLDENTLAKSKIYKNFIEDGDYVAAEAYLDNNYDLKQCAVGADIINHHSDAITATEIKLNEVDRKAVEANGKLGYSIANETNGVTLKINTQPLSIKGEGKVSVYDYNNSNANITFKVPEFLYSNFNLGNGENYDRYIQFGTSTQKVYESSFYIKGGSFTEYSSKVGCNIPNTEWFDPTGEKKDKWFYPLAIEGGIRTNKNDWYPFGYNDGNIGVNAHLGLSMAGNDYKGIVIECTGIQKASIACTIGIVKFYKE